MTATQLSRRDGRDWSPAAWRTLPVRQQPAWDDPEGVAAARAWLASRPGLVTPAEVRALGSLLRQAAAGRAFVFQAGDCAETFDPPRRAVLARRVRIIHRAAAIVAEALGLPVIPVGRIAGQYAKPRSSPTDTAPDGEIPAFRGHLVNSPEPTAEARRPDPRRMIQGYSHAAQTIRLLRALKVGGVPGEAGAPMLWTSHEALVLDYEEPLVRRADGEWILTSAHLPWIGMRTSSPDEAHVRFLAGVANPVACKVGPAATPGQIAALCARIDPDRQPGRLTFVARMGAGLAGARLAALVAEAARLRHPVVWMCDPMHGNTFLTATGHKSRHFGTIVSELREFVSVVRQAGGWPGGVHVEAAATDVTECVGGPGGLTEADVPRCYDTACDPRLNPAQTLEIARVAANLCAESSGLATADENRGGTERIGLSCAPSKGERQPAREKS